MAQPSANILSAAILAAGIAAAAWTLGSQFPKLRDTGSITVKGLAEAEYQAATGTWRIGESTWGQS